MGVDLDFLVGVNRRGYHYDVQRNENGVEIRKSDLPQLSTTLSLQIEATNHWTPSGHFLLDSEMGDNFDGRRGVDFRICLIFQLLLLKMMVFGKVSAISIPVELHTISRAEFRIASPKSRGSTHEGSDARTFQSASM